MFDKLLLLSEGKTMFYGDAKNAVEYFKVLKYPCPEDFNPSDFFLDLLSPDNRSAESEEETRNRIRHLGQAWLQHETDDNSASTAGKLIEDEADEFKSVKAIGTGFSLTKTLRNFVLLCWRSWTEQSRNKGVIIAKFVGCIIFALIMRTVYGCIHVDRFMQCLADLDCKHPGYYCSDETYTCVRNRHLFIQYPV